MVYNLTGQRVGKPTQKGIYLINGKKVLVKQPAHLIIIMRARAEHLKTITPMEKKGGMIKMSGNEVNGSGQ